MKRAVIIVAGGSGTRMGADIPKQFLPLNGVPVLIHTILAFRRVIPDVEVVLVLPKAHQHLWQKIYDIAVNPSKKEREFLSNICLAEGGQTRFESVRNGLEKLSHLTTHDLVAVHDGVRPLVSSDVINHCFDVAQEAKAVIPVVPMVDSLRQLSSDRASAIDNQSLIAESHSVIRGQYVSVQTPQVFEVSILRHAYMQDFDCRFTDDASVVEADGVKVFLVLGNGDNIKLTTRKDLSLAELLIQ